MADAHKDIPTAAHMRLDTLYHYQKFSPEHLAQTLSANTIFCSNPARFNDPWDCKPWFNKERLRDPAVRDEYAKWFDALGRKHFPKLDEAERQRRMDIMRSDPRLLEEMIDDCSRSIEAAIDSRYRVYCLTPNPLSTLMWSHYAGNHQGICLEFSVKNAVLCAAQKVEYGEVYPLLNLNAEDDRQNLLPLLTKSHVWSYEDEYRLIAQEASQAISSGTLMTRDNMLKLPAGALKSIIVGCMAASSTILAIEELVRTNGGGISVKKAVRIPNHYSLRIS